MEQFTDLHFAASTGDLASVRALVLCGIDLDAFDDIGFTALHHAAHKEQLQVILELLSSGANVDAQDENRIGNTPLGEVAGYCSLDVAKALVEHGADPRIAGWMGLSAIDRSRERQREDGVYDMLLAAIEKAEQGMAGQPALSTSKS